MKKVTLTLFLSLVCMILNAQYQVDARFANSEFFMNPVFAGDYPDPSIIKNGEDYYLVNSSFDYYPGLLIWHSKDLINWNPVKNALHRFVGSVWAPDLGKWWMIFHGYEREYLNMGRQILLEPVEWTQDGWFKIPDNIKTDKPIKRPYQKITSSDYTLNDDFSGQFLKPHWKFFREYDRTRFHLINNSIEIKAKGKSVGDCSPLLCIPSDHSYNAQAEIIIEGNAIGGLMLFYNNNFHSGILADNENILANLRGWQFTTERKVIENHVFLKLKNIENTVDMYYSTDGVNWKKIESSVEVSGFNHNTLGGFISLRIGLCSIGEGKVTFKNFKYEPIK